MSYPAIAAATGMSVGSAYNAGQAFKNESLITGTDGKMYAPTQSVPESAIGECDRIECERCHATFGPDRITEDGYCLDCDDDLTSWVEDDDDDVIDAEIVEDEPAPQKPDPRQDRRLATFQIALTQASNHLGQATETDIKRLTRLYPENVNAWITQLSRIHEFTQQLLGELT